MNRLQHMYDWSLKPYLAMIVLSCGKSLVVSYRASFQISKRAVAAPRKSSLPVTPQKGIAAGSHSGRPTPSPRSGGPTDSKVNSYDCWDRPRRNVLLASAYWWGGAAK